MNADININLGKNTYLRSGSDGRWISDIFENDISENRTEFLQFLSDILEDLILQKKGEIKYFPSTRPEEQHNFKKEKKQIIISKYEISETPNNVNLFLDIQFPLHEDFSSYRLFLLEWKKMGIYSFPWDNLAMEKRIEKKKIQHEIKCVVYYITEYINDQLRFKWKQSGSWTYYDIFWCLDEGNDDYDFCFTFGKNTKSALLLKK